MPDIEGTFFHSLTDPTFLALRKTCTSQLGVKEQYFGLCTVEPNTLLWVIHWPKDPNTIDTVTNEMQTFYQSTHKLDINSNPLTWFLPFDNADLVRPALTAPICQLCSIKLSVNHPPLAESLNKTFTDCYKTAAFIGGHWATALNDDKRHYYYLGWQTRGHRDEYAKTELFDEEMNKLIPHSTEGTTNFMSMIADCL